MTAANPGWTAAQIAAEAARLASAVIEGPARFLVNGRNVTSSTNNSLYLHTNFRATDKLSFSLGARYSLDDKRDAVKDNDLPAALERWQKRRAKKDSDRTAKHFMVPVKELEAKDFDLSLNRYKETKHEEVQFDPPKKIIAKLRALEAEIAKDLNELEAML